MEVVRVARLRADGGQDAGNQTGAETRKAARLCEVELIDLGGAEPRHLVNVRQGREGGALTETTRTPTPTSLEQARQIFDSVVVARLNAGFHDLAAPPTPRAAPGGDRVEAARAALADLGAGRLDAARGDRLLFRVGLIADPALGEAVLAALRGQDPRQASHAAIHALARCGRERAAPALEEIGGLATLDGARDLARYARASRWMGDLARPDPADAEALSTCGDLISLEAGEARAPGSASAALIALGRRGPRDGAARQRLLALLDDARPRPPFLRAFRRLFKFAELGDDAALFAATARAFELEAPMFRRASVRQGKLYWRPARAALSFPAEAASPSPRLALSDQTSFYLRRRVWRALRKRGELGHASFIEMGGALMARFEADDLAQGLGPFGAVRRVWSLAHLAFGEDGGVRFDETFLRVSGRPTRFTPPFEALWTREAAATLSGAVAARSAPVRAFLAERLAAIAPQRLLDHIDLLADLLASPEPALAMIAARALEGAATAPDAPADLLARLLDAPQEGLRRLALLAVSARPGGPWAEVPIGLAALLARQPDTVARVETWLDARPPEDTLARLARAFAGLLRAEPADIAGDRRAALETGPERLGRLAGGRGLGLTPQDFAALAAHPAPAVQAAGLRLLAVSGLPLDDLAEEFWARGLASPDDGMRAATARLIAALTGDALGRRAADIRAAVFDPAHAVRAAARPAAARLAQADPAFAETLFGAVSPHLFQSEPAEGFADDLAALVGEALRGPRDAMPVEPLWRLLQAQAKGARLVGADALDARGDEVFPALRWARLASHPFKAVRERALAVFERHQDWFRADPVAALGLLDTRWEDARGAALQRLLTWEPSAFPVEALANLADSPDPGVQSDARVVLRRAIAPGQGGAALQRLFEHPAPGFHLFVTELLTQESLADPDRFARFLEAARMILFRLGAGRAAKTRIWARLAQEAGASAERAAQVLPLVSEMSLSAVARDRAPALALLRDLAFLYPGLASPLAIRLASSAPSAPAANA